MQTPELSDEDDFSNLVFYGTFEDFEAMREAETPHTQTRIIHKPDETGEPGQSDYSITTKHGPRKQLVCQIHENRAVEQLLTTETQFVHSYRQELITTIAYVDYDQTIQIIKNMNPNFTCADVDDSHFDHKITQRKLYQCEDCEKFFSRISEYRKHLVGKICNTCGKSFSNHGKYFLHCLGHGNPDRECSGCRKVLANKYTLKKHKSICKKILTRKLREFRKPPKTASK